MNLRQKYKKLKQNLFADVRQIIVETDEENPTPVAVLSADSKEKEPVKVGEGYRVRFTFKKEKPEYLKDMPTAGLVEELSRREGVEKIIIEPYEDKEIAVNGPMIILKVMD